MNLNATYLFQLPHPKSHSSESFWTSLFALYLIHCSQNGGMQIPTYGLRKQGRYCSFIENGRFIIDWPLTLNTVLVEAQINRHLFPKLGTFPKAVTDLRPDISIIGEDRICLIEVKTIGAKLTQLDVYCQLVSLLQTRYPTEFYVLLSHGYEKSSDLPNLAASMQENPSLNIILWEDVLGVMAGSSLDLGNILGDVSRYVTSPEQFSASSE